MTIVYCIPQIYRPGGIERIVTIKANYLADVYGYEVVIVVSNQQGKPPFYPLSKKVELVDLGLDYDKISKYPLLKRLRERRRFHQIHKKKLAQILMRHKPDITVSTFTHEVEFLPQIKDGSKKVLEFHFCKGQKRLMAKAFGFSLPTKLAYYFKCWLEENVIIAKYNQFVVLTQEDAERWKSKISNVICISNILPFESEEQAVLKNHKVIAVGRLDAQKCFSRLIGLWVDVAKKCPDWTLNIYGEGNEREVLQKQINSLGLSDVVNLCGNSSDIKKHYLESSIFVMTSNYEGMPMTMLEAKSLGLPIVSYDFPCGPKDLIADSIDGRLIRNDDALEFVDALVSLMRNEELRVTYGAKGKENARLYSDINIMPKWRDLFTSLCSKSK